MTAPLLVVAGTGTEIGKTFVSTGILSSWSVRARTAGIKPVETGGRADADELERASTFHVTRFTPPYLLTDPVSPHLAARRDGTAIRIDDVIVPWVEEIRGRADAVVLELAGGLFSPLTEERTNADLVAKLGPTRVLLVAPDRIGVLHDVISTVRAAAACGVAIHGLVLSAPATPDASTGTNAHELARLLRAPPILARLPRAAPAEVKPLFDAILEQLRV